MKKKFKSGSIFLLLTLIVLLLGIVLYQSRDVIGKKYLTINGHRVFVELAQTPQEKSQGLSNRATLAEDRGMLFVFEEPKRWDFWMGGMQFGLDFIWIENSKVADITENVLPPAETNNVPVFIRPNTDVRYVLEVNQGWVERNQIKIGDRVTFHL